MLKVFFFQEICVSLAFLQTERFRIMCSFGSHQAFGILQLWISNDKSNYCVVKNRTVFLCFNLRFNG